MTATNHPAPQHIDTVIGERLKHWRNLFGITQDGLAQAMSAKGFEFFQSTIANVENGKRRVSIGEAVALAECLDIPLEKLTTPEITSGPWVEASLKYGARLRISALRKALDALTEARAARLGMEVNLKLHKNDLDRDIEFKGKKTKMVDFFAPVMSDADADAVTLIEKLLKNSKTIVDFVETRDGVQLLATLDKIGAIEKKIADLSSAAKDMSSLDL